MRNVIDIQMLVAGAIRRAARWSPGWNTVGWALSVGIFAAACFALFHLLRDVDVQKIGAAIYATPLWAVAAAVAAVVASYGMFTFYDFFALRTIGQAHIPYRIAALTGFLAYTIGHNVGATAVTAGAVRLRIYGAWGLGLLDIAKVAFITGLTFWLGNAVMLGLGIAYVPEAVGSISPLPPWLNRTMALAMLGVIAAYVIWLIPRPRAIGRNGWKVTLPSARLTLLQIGIGVLDLTLAALAMYVLISVHTSVELAPFMVVFVMASLLGYASHAPGSLGVFDAAMIVALPQVEKELLVASLLIFRGLYYVLPFCIAILVLGIRETWVAMNS